MESNIKDNESYKILNERITTYERKGQTRLHKRSLRILESRKIAMIRLYQVGKKLSTFKT